MPVHAQGRVILHKSVALKDVKIIFQSEKSIELFRGQFIFILYTIFNKPYLKKRFLSNKNIF